MTASRAHPIRGPFSGHPETRVGLSAPGRRLVLALPLLMFPLLIGAVIHATHRLRAPFTRAMLASVQEPLAQQTAQKSSAASAYQVATSPLAHPQRRSLGDGDPHLVRELWPIAAARGHRNANRILWRSSGHLLRRGPGPLSGYAFSFRGDPQAISSAGARGLFQVMPFHFGHTEDAFDPEVNARRGLNYLAKAWGLSGGDLAQTLAAYNGGLNLIGKPPSTWPDETRRYVAWGMGLWRDIQAGALPSPTLSAWLAAGGQRLCTQAQSRLALR